MTIFKEIVDEEFLTVSETKELLADIEAERALDEDRELPYELARAIEHANRFAVLEPAEAQQLVDDLQDPEGRRTDGVQDREPPAAQSGRTAVRLRPTAVLAVRRRTRGNSQRRRPLRLNGPRVSRGDESEPTI